MWKIHRKEFITMNEKLTQNVMLLSVNQFRVTDDKTGELNEGTTTRYLLSEDLNPCEDTKKSLKGIRPAKTTFPYEYYKEFENLPVPAYYEATLGFDTPDSKGNVKLIATGFKYLCGITVSKATTGGKINLSNKET
jgi:hypothetical protein